VSQLTLAQGAAAASGRDRKSECVDCPHVTVIDRDFGQAVAYEFYDDQAGFDSAILASHARVGSGHRAGTDLAPD
jgi:hypothetical protein